MIFIYSSYYWVIVALVYFLVIEIFALKGMDRVEFSVPVVCALFKYVLWIEQRVTILDRFHWAT